MSPFVGGEGAVEAGEVVEEADVVEAEEEAGLFLGLPAELLVPAGQGAVELAVDVELGDRVLLAGVESFPGEEDVDPLVGSEAGVLRGEEGAF